MRYKTQSCLISSGSRSIGYNSHNDNSNGQHNDYDPQHWRIGRRRQWPAGIYTLSEKSIFSTFIDTKNRSGLSFVHSC